MNYTGSLTPDIERTIAPPFFTCAWSLSLDRGSEEMIADGKRDFSLDFVKGVLVVLMLTFHTGSLFMADNHGLWILDEVLLNFVSGSWVFLSGYLVAVRYGKRVQSDISGTRKHLMLRGAKLIGIYALLNVGIAGFRVHPGFTGHFDIPTIVRTMLYGGGETTSFGVLLGIGYFLICAPLFLHFQHKTGMFTWFVLIGTSIASLVLISIPPNLWLILCGLVGMTLGFWFDAAMIARITRTTFGLTLLLVFSLVGAATHYTLLFLSAFTRDNLFVYLLGVVSMVTLLYISHRWCQPHSYIDEWLRLLGRYSLICYVLQMGILWGLWWLMSLLAITVSFILALATSLLVLIAIVWLMDRLISEHQAFKKVYGYAFH
jgi:hypothetical protein